MDHKHHEISRELAADIAAGKYAVNGRLPSEAQLVKRFKVSRPTVARALRDLEGEGLIERRAGSGSYVRAPSESRASRELGFLVAGAGSTEIFELICAELASLARVDGYGLLWGGAGRTQQAEASTPEQALLACEQFIERRVAGVFFTPFEHTDTLQRASREAVDRLREAGIPLILLDRDFAQFPRRSEFDLVGLDNFEGGFLAAEHLLRLGRTRLAFLAPGHSAPSVDARIAGAREAQLRLRVAPLPDATLDGDPKDEAFVSEAFAQRRFDAVICANDLVAAELLRTLDRVGVRVPRDLRIVGFDDAKYATLLRVPLTTVHQPCASIARTAYRALLDRMAEPTLPARSLLLSPRLVIRESCGAYLPRRSSPRAAPSG